MFNSLLLFVLFSWCIYSQVTCSPNSFGGYINDSLQAGAASLMGNLKKEVPPVLLGGLVSSSLGEEGFPVVGCAVGFTLGRLYHKFTVRAAALSIGVALLSHQKQNLLDMLLNAGVNRLSKELGAAINGIGSNLVGGSGLAQKVRGSSKALSVPKPVRVKARENALQRGVTHDNKKKFEAIWRELVRNKNFEAVWEFVCGLQATQPTVRMPSRL